MNIYDSSQILPNTNLVNPSNSHFSDPIPQFSSKVGVVSGYNGSVNSPAALRGEGIYKYSYNGGKNKKSKRKHMGKKNTTRGRKSMKHKSMKRKSMKRKSMKHKSMKHKSMKRKSMKHKSMKRSGRKMRGGNGYGMHVKESNNMLLGPSAGYANISSYKNEGVENPASLGASKQNGGGMFKGYVAFTPSYSVNVKSPLGPSHSALASPPPIKRINNCLNTWKHLGSEKKPYNKVWN